MVRKKQVGGRKVEGWKSKSWFKVYAPEYIGKQFIGEVVSSDTSNLLGRVLSVNLGDLIQDYSKQNVKMSFKIDNVAGNVASTRFNGHEISKDFIRVLSKRRASRIDSTITVKPSGSDNEIQITATTFTISHARLSQIHEIRAKMVEIITNYAKDTNYETFVLNMVKGEISKKLIEACKPIFPIRKIEFIKSESVNFSPEQRVDNTATEEVQ